MADNLLGILFVTSSPRGTTIFRYPPDPLSPIPRLAQPIYPKSTYTATDGVPDHHLSNHHGKARRPPPVELQRTSTGTLRADVTQDAKDEFALSSEDDSKGATEEQDDVPPLQTYYLSDRDDDSVDSSEDDSDGLWTPLGALNRTSPKVSKKELRSVSGANAPSTTNSDPTSGTGTPSRGPTGEPTSLLSAQVARSKLGLSQSHQTSTSLPSSPTLGPELPYYEARPHHPQLDVFTPRSYTHALSYPLNFLSDLLTPRRVECNKKFELIVDELAFIGHPVSVGPDGKWEIPKGDDDEEDASRPATDPVPTRGRAGRREAKRTNSSGGLDTVVEGQPTPPVNLEDKERSNSEFEQSPAPTLEIFHLVLILDRPDPTAEAQLLDDGRKRKGAYDEIYAQVAFKWTAAAWELQCRSGWIAKEVEKIVAIREESFQRKLPIVNCLQKVLKASSLARSLSALFNGLHHHALHPPTQLTSLPTTLSIPVDEHFLTIHLSARPEDSTAEAWTQWGNSDDGLETQSSDDDSLGWDSMEEEDEWNEMLIQGRRHKGKGISKEVKVEPWKTLLPLEDESTAKVRRDEELEDLAGLGIVMSGSRQNSIELEKAAAVGEDAALRRTFIGALDVSKPLFDIADALMYDLETVVLPLARDLIYSRKARLIDVVTPRFRGVFMPTTVAKRSTSIASYSAQFQQLFPSLPPFPAFMAKLSASPQPFKAMLPANASSGVRSIYLDCLLWLLRQDLLVQVHMRVRIFARREVKVEAWRRAWYRGREKWLKKEQRQRALEDMETPTAENIGSYPSVPPPGMAFDRRGSIITLENLSDLELDSDRDDGPAAGDAAGGFAYSMDEEKPPMPPKFEDSFIFKPARALKEETRWLKVIKDSQDEVWASKFDLCLQYFDGSTTPDEILYRTGMHRRDFDKILKLFEKDIITFLHP